MDLLKHLKNYSSAIKRRGYLESLNVKYLFLLFLFKYLLFDNSYIKHIIQCAFQCSFHFSSKKKKCTQKLHAFSLGKITFCSFFFLFKPPNQKIRYFPSCSKGFCFSVPASRRSFTRLLTSENLTPSF